MSEKTCIHCGRTVHGEELACSTGCDLARRLPLGEAVMPASWELGGLLLWGFVGFNQLLLAAGDLRLQAREDWEMAETFGTLSLVAGVLVLLANVYFLGVAKPKRWTDAAAIAVAAAAGIGLGRLADGWLGEALVVGFAIFNLLISIWLARGLRFGRESKNRQKAG